MFLAFQIEKDGCQITHLPFGFSIVLRAFFLTDKDSAAKLVTKGVDTLMYPDDVDNVVAVYCLNHHGASRSEALLTLSERIFQKTHGRALHLSASHVPCVKNSWADALPRFQGYQWNGNYTRRFSGLFSTAGELRKWISSPPLPRLYCFFT